MSSTDEPVVFIAYPETFPLVQDRSARVSDRSTDEQFIDYFDRIFDELVYKHLTGELPAHK